MGVWKRWIGWCTTTEVGTTLAAVRIGLGVLIFIDLITLITSGVGFSLFSPLKDGGMAGNMAGDAMAVGATWPPRSHRCRGRRQD